MKKLSLIFLLLTSSLITKSQISMLDSNYVWANFWGCYFDGDASGYSYNSVGGDTLLDGEIYKKIYNGSSPIGYPNYFLREDSGFVYNQYEEVYYNFHLQVGDTFTFPQSSMMPYLDVIVDSVTTEFIFGQTRKVIKFDFLNMEWIEGVGSTTGLLYDDVWYWDCNQYLNCFYDGIDTYLGEGFDTCQIYNGTIGINTHSESLKIDLYPNPAKDLLNISSIKNVNSIIIFNSFGLLVKQIDNKNMTKINVKDLTSGLYFFQIQLDDKSVLTKKVIVE
jgi:hypothetical protein